MGKALVIRGVNFSANRLTTITLIDEIMCTSIALNYQTRTMTSIGSTFTITAAVQPANTTDVVEWSSSDTSVATVINGVVTQRGIGSCNIVATCGSKSATCVVSATNVLAFDYQLSRYVTRKSSSEDFAYEESGSASYAAIFSRTATTKNIWNDNYQTDGRHYPILLGSGASHINISAPDTVRVTMVLLDSETACTYSASHSGYSGLAKVISNDASAYDSTVATGNRTIDVPSGVDSAVFTIQYPGNTLTNEIVGNVSITVV